MDQSTTNLTAARATRDLPRDTAEAVRDLLQSEAAVRATLFQTDAEQWDQQGCSHAEARLCQPSLVVLIEIALPRLPLHLAVFDGTLIGLQSEDTSWEANHLLDLLVKSGKARLASNPAPYTNTLEPVEAARVLLDATIDTMPLEDGAQLGHRSCGE